MFAVKAHVQVDNPEILENNPEILENNPDNQDDKKKEEELCDKMADILEKIFTSLFFMAFIIYCCIVFTQKPNY